MDIADIFLTYPDIRVVGIPAIPDDNKYERNILSTPGISTLDENSEQISVLNMHLLKFKDWYFRINMVLK